MSHTVTVEIVVESDDEQEAMKLVEQQLELTDPRIIKEANVQGAQCDDCTEVQKRGGMYKSCLCDHHDEEQQNA